MPTAISDDQVKAALHDHPGTLALVEEARDFFGDRLYIFSEPGQYAHGSQLFRFNNADFVDVVVCLDMDWEGLPYTIAHEFLHTQLAIKGFPVSAGTLGNSRWLPLREPLDKIKAAIFNGMDHATFRDDVVSLGFDSEIGRHPFDSEEASKFCAVVYAYDRPACFALWGLEFVNQHIADLYTQQDEPAAAKLVEVGRPLFGELVDESARDLTLWCNQAGFRNASERKEAVDWLFEYVGAPPTVFCEFSKSNGVLSVRKL